MNDKFLFKIKTVQSDAIKTLIETLKEILKDVPFIFDSTGIRLLAQDPTKVALVYVKLDSNKFDQYYCKSRVVVGVNLITLSKLLKVLSKEDTLTFFMEAANRDELGIELKNSQKKTKTTLRLRLLETDEEKIRIPNTTFESIIIMPSGEFHKICKDMSGIGDNIEIKSIKDTLIFNCIGDSAKQETIIGKSDEGLTFDKESDQIIQGLFSLKFLLMFTKASNLHSSVQILIKNDWPLILEYSIAGLGKLRFCLAPKCKE